MSKFCTPFVHFPHGFRVVMVIAKALMICWVNEQLPVAAMRNNVVDDAGPDSLTFLRTFPTKRLAQKLRRSEFFLPKLGFVHPMPLGAFLPLLRLRFMRWAPALVGKLGASWPLTRPQRFSCHGCHLPAKKQSRSQSPHPSGFGHWPRLSKHWPISMSTGYSVLHRRQNRISFSAFVSGLICISFA